MITDKSAGLFKFAPHSRFTSASGVGRVDAFPILRLKALCHVRKELLDPPLSKAAVVPSQLLLTMRAVKQCAVTLHSSKAHQAMREVPPHSCKLALLVASFFRHPPIQTHKALTCKCGTRCHVATEARQISGGPALPYQCCRACVHTLHLPCGHTASLTREHRPGAHTRGRSLCWRCLVSSSIVERAQTALWLHWRERDGKIDLPFLVQRHVRRKHVCVARARSVSFSSCSTCLCDGVCGTPATTKAFRSFPWTKRSRRDGSHCAAADLASTVSAGSVALHGWRGGKVRHDRTPRLPTPMPQRSCRPLPLLVQHMCAAQHAAFWCVQLSTATMSSQIV